MTYSDFRQLLERLASEWTNRDYASVAKHFTDDVFYSDSQNYTLRNRASLLAFFEDDDGKPQHCEFHNAILDEDRQLGVAEYTYEGRFAITARFG